MSQRNPPPTPRAVITEIRSHAQFRRLNRFAHVHWGETADPTDLRLNFFDTPSYAVSVFLGARRVSLLFVFIRNVSVGSGALRLAGIGGVVTHRQHRHAGHASRLLEATHAFLRGRVDLLLLCTDVRRLGRFYGQVGYTALGKPYYYTDALGRERATWGGMIVQLRRTRPSAQALKPGYRLHVGRSNF